MGLLRSCFWPWNFYRKLVVLEKKGSVVLTARVEALLNQIQVAALDHDADRYYGRIRAQLEREGKTIGANDLMIAAHALALDAVLVTGKVDEFKRVNGLKIENWLGYKVNPQDVIRQIV